MLAKTCTKCKRDKTLDQFSFNPLGKLKRKSWCHTCVKIHARAMRKAGIYKDGSNPPPGTKCEICGSAEKICYDHDHNTEKFRGWLCAACNSGLGFFKDDPKRLAVAIAYLELP